MAIKDRNIDWLRQVHRIPAWAFVAASTTTGLVGVDTGAAPMVEVSTFGFPGLAAAATTQRFTCLDLLTPAIADYKEEIGVRVIFTNTVATSTTTTDDTVTWVAQYDQVDEEEALVTPGTALSTAIAAYSAETTTALILRSSARGVINANVFDASYRKGSLAWSLRANYSQFSASEVVLLGLEIDYIPKLTTDSEEDQEIWSGRVKAG